MEFKLDPMHSTMSLRLTDFLNPSTILVGVEAEDKMTLIDRLVNALAGHGAQVDLDEVREAVKQREATMSTGVGKGVGLPHAKTSAVQRTMAALAILAEPIDFGSFDDEPVRLVLLVVEPITSRTQHVLLLSRISRILNYDPTRGALLKAKGPREILTLLNEAETALFAN